jgi:hypothetical protein
MTFEEDLQADSRFERRLFWRELLILVVVLVLVVLRVVVV